MNKILAIVLTSIILCSCAITPRDIPKLYKKDVSAVVAIHIERTNSYTGERQICWNGTGFIINKYEGWIVTAGHVVRNSPILLAELSTGVKITAEIYLADPENDIAVLKVDPKLLELIDIPDFQLAIAPTVGGSIFSIGHPHGFFNTISYGILSHGLIFDNTSLPMTFAGGVYLADFQGFGGSSGSPVFNLENEIVGMVMGGIANFIILVPANSIDRVLKQNGV